MSLAISIEEEEGNGGGLNIPSSHEQASTSGTFSELDFSESVVRSKLCALLPRQTCPPLMALNGHYLSGRASTAFYKLLTRLEEETRILSPSSAPTRPSSYVDGGELWVEKYRPRRFTDLLAMDSAHIEVLQWAMQWRRHIKGVSAHEDSSNCKRRKLHGASCDEKVSPFERSILLIHGPPGLGKTTLAHIVAEVGNFTPLEINASDERSGEGVLGRIKAALGSDSLDLQGLGRPHMIIIDEIDGAAAGASEKSLITFLVKLANSTMATTSNGKGKGTTERETTKTTSEDDHDDEEGARKESHNAPMNHNRGRPFLTRPIICICNDIFVSALKPLRQAHTGVRVVSMRRPTTAAIRQRLAEVCEKEGLRLEGKAFLELIDMMDGDIRACLHALQFISRSASPPVARGKRVLNVTELREALRTAIRDVGRSTATVYESIFYADPLYKHHHVRGEPSLQQAVLDTILAHGEYERLATGAFELYPQCKFFDDTKLSRVNRGLEWLAFFDTCSTAAFADERMVAYQPYALLKFHYLFSSSSRPTFKFPRGDYEQHLVMRSMQEILRSYQTGLQQLHRKPFDQYHLLCERIPIVLQLIRPPAFRTTNFQLLRAEERTQLCRLVQLMLSEGLNYRQVSGEDDNYVLILEPPLETLASFSPTRDMGDAEGSSRARYTTSSMAIVGRNSNLNGIRQMIASKVELERIRRGKRGRLEPDVAPVLGRRAELQKAYADMDRMKGQLGSRDSGGGLSSKAQSAIKKDFFGRPLPPPLSPHAEAAGPSREPTEERPLAGRPSSQPVEDRVWFKFNEGFTNAVRRPVRIRDLFTNLDKT